MREHGLAWIPFLCSLPMSVSVWHAAKADDPVLILAFCLGMNVLLALSVASLERYRIRALASERRVAAELHDSVRGYRSIVDTAADAIVIADQAGVIRSFNAAAARIFGYAADEAIGQRIGILMPEAFCVDNSRLISAYCSTGSCRPIGRSRTVEGRRKDGSLFPLDLSVAEWRDVNNASCFTAIMRDVTGRHRTQEALRFAKEQAEFAARTESVLRQKVEAANRELEDANHSLHKFTSIVAHDLRAPLRRVEAFVDAFRADYADKVDEEGADILCRIERGTRRMRVMLNALLDYSKCDGNAVLGKIANVTRVVEETLDLIDLDTDGVDVKLNLNDVSHVRGDPVLLGHVIQNLIGNAIKFRSAARPVIDITATQSADSVTVAVTDNGIGIEPEFACQVFDMFCRLHDEDEYEGSGIGLAICKKIVRDHGGRIWIDTSHVGGTRILFTLVPAKVGETAAIQSVRAGRAA